MIGLDFKEYLSLEERNQFIDNFNKCNCKDESIESYLQKEHKSFYHFIFKSFYWGDTPEKSCYWLNISKR